MDARDRALALLACQRGLVTPAALQGALARRAPDERVPDLLVRHGLLQPPALAALARELAQAAFWCDRCRVDQTLEQLAGVERLVCRRCGGALAITQAAPRGSSGFARPTRPTERFTAAAPRQGADDLDRYVSEDLTESGPPGPAAVGSASWPPASGSLPGPRDTRSGSERFATGPEGRRLGPYVIERELGRGSNGVVYLARRPGVEGPLALKVLRDADLADEETIKRFELEAAVAQKLRHPGLIAVFDAGREGETRYFVMEFCAGRTLKEILQQGRMPVAEATRVLHALATAMAVAHDGGVIHRDLKPANVIIDDATGQPRVTDFGLARDRSLLQSMTRTGDVIGTPFYMAPEQLRGEKALDHRIDIYALGVLLYECLTGQRPYKADTFIQLVEVVTKGEQARPSAVAPDVPGGLEAIVLKAMAREPDARYRSCHELAEDLERVQAGKRPRAPLPRRAAGGAGGDAPSRALAAMGVVGVLGAGVVVALVLATSRGDPPPPVEPVRDGGGATVTRSKDLRTLRKELDDALAPRRSLAERASALERLLPTIWDDVVREQATLELARARVRLALQDVARAGEEDAEAALAQARIHARGLPAVEREVALAAAHQQARRGRFADAAATLESAAADAGPIGREARLLLGFVLEKQGRGQAARAAYGAVDGDGAPRYCARAALARLDGELPEAELNAKSALEHDEGAVAGLLELARVKIERDDLAPADALLIRARSAAPSAPEVDVLDARIKLREGKTDSAALAIERALALTRGAPDPDALVIRARIALDAAAQPRLDAAARDLDEALAVAPEHVEALLWRGAVRHRQNDRVGAGADWRRAFAADRARCERLAAALRPSEVLRAFRAQVGLEATPRPTDAGPGDPRPVEPAAGGPADALVDALTTIGAGAHPVPKALEARYASLAGPVRDDMLQAAGAAARGREWKQVGFPLQRAERFIGDDPAARLAQARLFAARDRVAEAAAVLDAAGAAAATSHERALLRAELALRAGDPGEGLRRLDALAAADPDGLEGRAARAWIRLLHGDAAAIADGRADGPHLTSTRLARALALQEVGRPGEAAQELQAVLQEEGATDSRVVALSIVYTVLHLQRAPELLPGVNERVIRGLPDDAIFRAFDRPYVRELAAECLLAGRDPAVTVLQVARDLLDRAAQQEPRRASNHLLRARHALLAQRSRDEILGHWRRARELSPGAPISAADKARFDARFGETDVEALLPR